MAGQWTQLTVKVKTKDTERASDILGMLECGIMIEDYSDFSLNGMYGELVDEAILNADKEHSKISIFVPEERNVSEYTAFASARLDALGIKYELSLSGMNEEEWSESWKKYFNVTPTQYINNLRLEAAARQLKESNIPISEIIREVHFSGKYMFYQRFRQKYGMTPDEYRKRHSSDPVILPN